MVHEACQKQKIITKSSTKAELVALSDYIPEGELLEDFLMDLGNMMGEDLITDVHKVFQDNQPTITLVESGGGKLHSKYMIVRREYMKDIIDRNAGRHTYQPVGRSDLPSSHRNSIGKAQIHTFEQQGCTVKYEVMITQLLRWHRTHRSLRWRRNNNV